MSPLDLSAKGAGLLPVLSVAEPERSARLVQASRRKAP